MAAQPTDPNDPNLNFAGQHNMQDQNNQVNYPPLPQESQTAGTSMQPPLASEPSVASKPASPELQQVSPVVQGQVNPVQTTETPTVTPQTPQVPSQPEQAQSFATAAVPASTITGDPPPPPQVAPSEPMPENIPEPGGSGVKKFAKIAAVLLVLLLIGYGIIALLLPRLRGVSGPQSVTLTWWGLWEDQSIIAPLISEYQSQNPHVTINYVHQAKEDYRERLTNALARGDGPDIFRFHNTWVPMFARQLDQMPESVMSKSDFARTFYPVMSKDLLSSGGYVGVPLEYEGLAMFVNEDIFANATKSIPTTWDELRTTAQELTIRDSTGVITQAGVAIGLTSNVDHWPEILGLMMLQNGANLADPTGTLSVDAMRFYTSFATGENAVWDSAQPNSTVAFASGNLAMYFGPSWRVFEIERINPSLNYRVVELPQIPKTSPTEPDIAYASYWVEGVSQSSSNKEEAWKFLVYLAQRESLEKFFTNASALRSFGEPYPRVDMRDTLLSHEYLSAFAAQAADAQSWYLASRTWDGPTGINTQLANYYEDAVNAVVGGEDPIMALTTASQGINQVLSQFGLAQPIPAVAR